MGIYVLKTPEGKTLKVNTTTDEKIYQAPINPPNTGVDYTRGTDLFLHVSRSGQRYFYKLRWSLWQGERDEIILVSEDETKEFLLAKAGVTGYSRLNEKEWARAEELFPGIFEETA